MNRPCKGTVLLVGEGDFSLSVALRKQLSDVDMVTSSLLSEHEIMSLHQQAAQNITLLKQTGAEVLLTTDATALHKNPKLYDHKFERIIFNFPHVGGKSNIKKNRELLKNFFLSASHLLTAGGEIMVTLCNGQGGTPADKPQRTWHNCWQIVSMATYANLILKETIPFQAVDYPEYHSSGFRSQDKHFHTEDAVTHVFVKAAPIPDFSSEPQLISINNLSFYCSSYVARRMDRSPHRITCHPVCLTRQYIEDRLQHCLPAHIVGSSPLSAAISVQDLKLVDQEGENHRTPRYRLHVFDTTVNNYPMSAAAEISVPKTCGTEEFVLCHSLLDHLPAALKRMTGNYLYLFSGQVYPQTPITDEHLTVCHEVLGVLPLTLSEHSDFQQCLLNLLHDLTKQQVKCVSDKSPTLMHSNYRHLFSEDCLYGLCLETDDGIKNKMIGIYGRLRQEHLNMLHEGDCESVMIFILNLDLLAVTAFSLPDIRLLWSDLNFEIAFPSTAISDVSRSSCVESSDVKDALLNDLHDIEHLHHKHGNHTEGHVHPREYRLSHSLSLYPPVWEHHISFWLNDAETFDEQKFCDIIRDMADALVKSVTLKETYRCPDTGRISYCYQELFQSCDRALSYHKSHDLQTNIRLKIADALGVELR